MTEIQDFNIKRQNQMSQNLKIIIFNLIHSSRTKQILKIIFLTL